MKRSPMPGRRTPMSRGKPMSRTAKAATCPAKPKPRRQRDTGPTDKVRALVHARSGDRCEWPGCPNRRAHVHHRLNRKEGGRHGEMRIRINQPAWLLDACVEHHGYVTSPVGEAMEEAIASGWMLVEGQNALLVSVLTRHADGSVLLDNAGGWTPEDE